MARAPTVFGTDSNRGLVMAFWIFFGAITFVPTLIGIVDALNTPRGVPVRSDDWGSVVGALIVLGCVIASSMKESLVVDPGAKTLSWRRTVFGATYRLETWAWSDVTAVESVVNSRLRSRGRRADVSGPRGRRTICSYFHSRPPEHVKELAKELRVPLVEKK